MFAKAIDSRAVPEFMKDVYIVFAAQLTFFRILVPELYFIMFTVDGSCGNVVEDPLLRLIEFLSGGKESILVKVVQVINMFSTLLCIGNIGPHSKTLHDGLEGLPRSVKNRSSGLVTSMYVEIGV